MAKFSPKEIINGFKDDNINGAPTLISYMMGVLWWAYAFILLTWLIYLIATGDCHVEDVFYAVIFPIIIMKVVHLAFNIFIKKEKMELKSPAVFAIVNCYLLLMLLHPSGILVLDGLFYVVFASFPVWGNKYWVRLQLYSAAVFVVIRHVIIYYYCQMQDIYIVNFIGMLVLGWIIFRSTQYVHKQTQILGHASKMDSLTGLYNHESFYEELELRMNNYNVTPAIERANVAFSVMIADIDNFKKVNDTYGHAYGDKVIVGLSDLFKKYCGGKDFAARYGGEEFVLILGGASKGDALTRANTIRKQFAATSIEDLDGINHQFTCSIGVAVYEGGIDSSSKFFDKADQALYEAKKTGKNRVCSS